ncbi:hypothetical protein [Stigmatella aurantiaca]|uniref:hypothetical protein n=1 Tax=Stigmatella aurantiaca TaxID=41 RepID=UPI00031F547C|nr:hypothetical protein [Stigmatella aurantiaca]
MRFAPTPMDPPWPYSASKVLSRPKRELSTDDVIKRLRRFSRNGLLKMGAEILWYAWNHSDVLENGAPGSIGNFITRTYSERLITLAGAFASSHNRAEPAEVDFRLLCWELHQCSDGPVLGPDVLQEVSSRLVQLPKDSPLRKLDTAFTHRLMIEAFKARIVAAQFEGRIWDKASLIRPLLIARELASLGRKAGGDAYDRAERQFFLTSLEGFFRAAWAIYTKASDGVRIEAASPRGPVIVHDHGRFRGDSWQFDSESQEHVGLTEDDVRAVTSRLSMPLSKYAERRAALRQMDPAVRKYDGLADVLVTRPLVDLELERLGEDFLLPSPWRFISGMGTFVLHEFVSFLQAHRATALGGQDAYALRGEAFGNYLRDLLRARPGVHDCDAPEMGGLTSRKPDFLWVGEEYGVMVEAKVFLRPNEDRLLVDATSAVETWRRAAETISQAVGLLRNSRAVLERHIRLPEKWVLIVVSNEDLIESTTGFKGVARAGNLLDGTGLDALALLSSSEFEDWVVHGSPDELARQAVQAWSNLKPGDLGYDSRVSRQSSQRESELPHIAEAWSSLIPA